MEKRAQVASLEKKRHANNSVLNGSTQEVSSLVPHFKVEPLVHSSAPSSPNLGAKLGHQLSPDTDIMAQLQLLSETQKKLEQVGQG